MSLDPTNIHAKKPELAVLINGAKIDVIEVKGNDFAHFSPLSVDDAFSALVVEAHRDSFDYSTGGLMRKGKKACSRKNRNIKKNQ